MHRNNTNFRAEVSAGKWGNNGNNVEKESGLSFFKSLFEERKLLGANMTDCKQV